MDGSGNNPPNTLCPPRASCSDVATPTEIPVLQCICDVLNEAVMILDPRRRVVFANRRLLELADAETADEIYGRLPGEVLNCRYAMEEKDRCGCMPYCAFCGEEQAVRQSRERAGRQVQQCRILQHDGRALTFRVAAESWMVKDRPYTVVALVDVSSQARCRVLEQVVFHDVMNVAVGLRGLAELLVMADDGEVEDFCQRIQTAAGQIIRELESHRVFRDVEYDRYQLDIRNVSTGAFIHNLVSVFQQHPAATRRTIEISRLDDVPMETDETLLFHVLSHMIRNALEAMAVGGKVQVACVEDEQQVVFSVHNQTVMPEDAQRQVFQRHFTTKGRGHGLGTYSMQRISSKYLDGCVWFAVQPQSGTTFYARYPRKLKPVPTHDKQVAVMPDTTSVDLPVLVAEDNRVNALLIERTLKAMGLDCAVVVDGDEAVEAVKKNAYALILMDVQMPHVNGLEATRTIRTLPGSVSQCMILGLTGDRSREALEECLAAGMNAVLNKPLKKKELTGAVSQWLSENNNREQ